jgi:2'-5' RNA ligase
MPLAVTLPLEPVAGARVEAMMAKLTECVSHAYPPHISIAVLDDALDAAGLCQALVAEVTNWPALQVAFAGLGVFSADSTVLWLAPKPTKGLLHVNVCAMVGLQSVHPHYRPGEWVPHLTLAQGLTAEGAALPAPPAVSPLDAVLRQAGTPRGSSICASQRPYADRTCYSSPAARFTVNARMIVLNRKLNRPWAAARRRNLRAVIWTSDTWKVIPSTSEKYMKSR